ncbi:MAG: ATP-binding protein [Muribaculaceae bacterium]
MAIFAAKKRIVMKTTILQQRAERDELLSRPYQQRHTKYDAVELLQNPLIKLITGPRRVGKSVFALLMLQGKNFAYLNFDDNQLLENWDEELAMTALDDVYPDYDFMLLDEIQNLPDWDLWVSKLYRRGKNLVITGSNAKMLSSEMATALTGRYLQIEMLPFSLDETMRWKNISPDREEQAAQAIVLADDYMRNGGYPETIQARSITKSYLSTLFDSILLKDVAKRHNVRNTTDLYNLASYLLSNFCNPISANELAGELGLSSVATTKKFCNYLNEPYLFFYLPRFNNKLKLMNKAPKKVYVVDNGFVQSTAFNLSENLGRLLENQVFVELMRRGCIPGQTLFYYRTRNDKEIDFVTRKDAKVEQLIQVCYDMTSGKTRKRELDALVEAADELNCDNLLVVTNAQQEKIEWKGRTINVIERCFYSTERWFCYRQV